jgi:hypothetical protein
MQERNFSDVLFSTQRPDLPKKDTIVFNLPIEVPLAKED